MKLRIIPTVLFNDNLCVKGKNFKSWRVSGSLKQTIRLYSLREVDELIFLNINANAGKINFDVIDDFADECFMPITVGGGIKYINDIRELFQVGADRVSINTHAFKDINFLKEAMDNFGKQSIVISVDYKKVNNEPIVFINSGKTNTNKNLFSYLSDLEKINPGEILINSIDHDGLMNGYDTKTIKKIDQEFDLKFICSGGLKSSSDIIELYNSTKIKSFSMSSVFHYTELTPMSLKRELNENGVSVRL
ncbi:HisA/HisF-related TIM barrel protein [Candidatus Pelagibacter bacterium]|nr:HisA/HisF-related TIM barrel protein [Candidatus Pelagibacter bacterium]MDA8844345.1 HisA/HisF-related TIM barrel protein [Candidatus Pelagibacter bacterium]